MASPSPDRGRAAEIAGGARARQARRGVAADGQRELHWSRARERPESSERPPPAARGGSPVLRWTRPTAPCSRAYRMPPAVQWQPALYGVEVQVGIVSDYLRDLIAKQVDDRGLVVWFDPEGHYRAFAETLAIPRATVARYIDSFFALRQEVDPLLEGEQPPRLVVYVPRSEGTTQDA